MHRNTLLSLLRAYPPQPGEEQIMHERLIRFVETQADCFERTLEIGHITGSAWIVNRDRSRVLLTHHRKLDRWLQLGGHSDGDPVTLQVALREAREESGVDEIKPVTTNIFDVDIHLIPARSDEPEHYHYDVRFLLETDDAYPIAISAESKDLAWVPIEDVVKLTDETSMMRMVGKTRMLLSR